MILDTPHHCPPLLCTRQSSQWFIHPEGCQNWCTGWIYSSTCKVEEIGLYIHLFSLLKYNLTWWASQIWNSIQDSDSIFDLAIAVVSNSKSLVSVPLCVRLALLVSHWLSSIKFHTNAHLVTVESSCRMLWFNILEQGRRTIVAYPYHSRRYSLEDYQVCSFITLTSCGAC